MYTIRFTFDFKNTTDCLSSKNYFGSISPNNKDCPNSSRILIYGLAFEISIKRNYYK